MPSKRRASVKASSGSPKPTSPKKVKLTGESQPTPLRSPKGASLQEIGDHEEVDSSESRFLGEPLPADEARERWPHRYQEKKKNKRTSGMNCTDDSEEMLQAFCHYTRAMVDGRVIFNLHDDAYVKAGDGEDNYICKIVEMFETEDGKPYVTAQWFYRARDTVIKNCADLIDDRRVFFSEIRDDNPLDCLVEKLKIVKVPLSVDLGAKRLLIQDCNYYCDTLYLLPYSTFTNLAPENTCSSSESTISSEPELNGANGGVKSDYDEVSQIQKPHKSEVTLLDLYSGCGAMSTGLCLGADMAGLNLVTRWAVDLNKHACESLKLNHPETEVRNEAAQDFLSLLKEWRKLCIAFSLVENKNSEEVKFFPIEDDDDEGDNDDGEDDKDNAEDPEVFEVDRILAICYGDPKENKESGLYFKVSWKGYGPSEDTWEPIQGLSNCKEKIKEFVTDGYNSKMFPFPGDVDVICGGPPCQGISGFNRFRNKENPLEDPKNEQLAVFMDFVDYLKPRFVLMENVVDLVKFANGFLGRYALARLLKMNYQARMGLMAAGCYGLPQFRMRVFLWGACPTEKLPQYPLPTNELVVRGVIPSEFEINVVAYNEGQKPELKTKLFLKDAISDLPAVTNYEKRDEMPYGGAPLTEFQQFIRLRKHEVLGSCATGSDISSDLLFDHRPLELNEDDYQRVCQIPKHKGANFRNLPGVHVRADNKVEWDPDVERVYLPSGKPLVPDYAMTFVKGTSSKPFSRLWWDETVPTVVTRAEPHNQTILHPEQDRVLSIRENARLQGFPDYYKLCGPIKERYIQVGNAVAVPVARALGYALGLACQGSATNYPLFTLPENFPNIVSNSSASSENDP